MHQRVNSISCAKAQPPAIYTFKYINIGNQLLLLKKTGVESELLTDLDMHLFIEQGMRGGILMVGKRYAKANNPLVEGYNPTEPKTTSYTLVGSMPPRLLAHARNLRL